MQPIPTRRAPGRALLLAAAAAPLAAQFPNQFSLHFDQGRLPPATSPFNALLPACSSAQDVLLRDFHSRSVHLDEPAQATVGD